MIIGSAFGRLFDGLTVDLNIDGNDLTRNIQYHYGDQKELLKWVLDRNNSNSEKYPLVWYVVAPYYEQEDYKVVTSSLIILQQTRVEWFNDTRTVMSYDDIIEPVWQKVKKTIEQNEFISVMGNIPRKYIIKDEPNFGVDNDGIRLSQSDFSSKSTKNDESITIDTVDGRVINMNFRIKTNCI